MNYSKKYGKGWYNESRRHKLARLGIKTGKKTKRRPDIITNSFRSGGKVLKTEIEIGKKGDIEKIYEELLIPHGPGIGFSKKKQPIKKAGKLAHLFGRITDGTIWRSGGKLYQRRNGVMTDITGEFEKV